MIFPVFVLASQDPDPDQDQDQDPDPDPDPDPDLDQDQDQDPDLDLDPDQDQNPALERADNILLMLAFFFIMMYRWIYLISYNVVF